MKVFHFSMHHGCCNDIKNIITDLDSSSEIITKIPEHRPHEAYMMDAIKADAMWEEHKNNILTSDLIVFSDTTPMSWCLLKNIHKLSKNQKVVLWITNRFNYANENNRQYYDLLNSVKSDKRLYILYANKFEKYYLNHFIDTGDSQEYMFLPYGKRNKQDYFCKNHPNYDKLYVMSYQNETTLYPMIQELESFGIEYNQKTNRVREEDYCGPFELENSTAVLHIPYSWGTIAFSEYISLGKTFILPSLSWLNEKYKTHNLWFQTSKDINLIKQYSLWYSEDYSNCFLYFDRISDIKLMCNNKQLLSKKENICKSTANSIQSNNIEYLKNILEKL